MQSHLSSPWNQATCYLEMHREQHRLATGSAFFWRATSRTFLVTNWHNVTGRNPLTNELMSETAAIPDRISFGLYRQVSQPRPDGFYEIVYLLISSDLNDATSKPRWFEHPSFGQRVDVAAMDVTDEVQGFLVSHANEIESDVILRDSASRDVFVVGFPFGLIAGAPAPIWKRGSIAMDPTYDPEGLPKILIDTATRSGMSGFVVIARQIVFGRQVTKKDGTTFGPVLYGTYDSVLGIYSGRHYPDFEKAQLGIVWKRRVIEETVEGLHRGSV